MKQRGHGPTLAGLFATALAIAACSPIQTDTFEIASRFTRTLLGQHQMVTREQAAAVEYASIGVQIGRDDQAMLVLGSDVAGEMSWFSSNKVLIATRNGRIVATAGLTDNLGRVGTLNASPWTGEGNAPLVAGQKYKFLYDLPQFQLYSVPIDCEASAAANDETITIMDAEIETRHLTESCESEELGWSFENEFWLDKTTGYVWRSVQTINPKLPPITIEVLRPEQ